MNKLNKTQITKLHKLGQKAWKLNANDETWGNDDCMDADEAFWTFAHGLMTKRQRDELDDLCCKATAAECIEHGFRVLGVEFKPNK